MFVCIYWGILEQCILPAFPICYLSLSTKGLLGYDTHKNRVQASDFTCYWHCAGSVELVCFVIPMQVFKEIGVLALEMFSFVMV